jgi:hypothetical protein
MAGNLELVPSCTELYKKYSYEVWITRFFSSPHIERAQNNMCFSLVGEFIYKNLSMNIFISSIQSKFINKNITIMH